VKRYIQGFYTKIRYTFLFDDFTFFFKSIEFITKNNILFTSNMSSSSKNKKRVSVNTESPSNKKQNTGNTNHEDLIWVDISNKTSWVWKHFKLATNGKTYCFYVETINEIEKTCKFSCAYNSQTSSMNYHLNSIHKVYKKKRVVCIMYDYYLIFIKL